MSSSQSLESALSRLASVESELSEQKRQRHAVEQRYLDIDTTEKIVSRLMKWTKLFAYWVGIPATLIILAVVGLIGKQEWDPRQIAVNVHKTLDPILKKANEDANAAKTNARAASQDALNARNAVEETNREIKSTSSGIQETNAHLSALDEQIKSKNTELTKLTAATNQQANEINKLHEQVRNVQTTKLESEIGGMIPSLGQHRVTGPHGRPLEAKAAGKLSIDVNINLVDERHPKFDPAKLSKALEPLQENNSVLLGEIFLLAQGPQGLGPAMQITEINSSFCGAAGPPSKQGQPTGSAPCVVYFIESNRSNAQKIQHAVSGFQNIPDDKLIFFDPQRADPDLRELIEKSGLDIVVVFGPF